MKRALMLAIGGVLSITIALVILGLFVHRPPECGEPTACGDDYLFPALYFSGLAFAATFAVAVLQAKGATNKWSAFLLRMAAWVAVVACIIALAYIT